MRTFLLAALAVAVTAAPAHAELLNRAPATHVYADGLLREAVGEADKRWQYRGYEPCAGEVFVYDEREPNVIARGELGGCDVFFSRRYRDRVWAQYTNPRRDRVDRRPILEFLLTVATHERGHNLGFVHGAGGVMSVPPRVPWQARRWAAWKLPRFGRAR